MAPRDPSSAPSGRAALVVVPLLLAAAFSTHVARSRATALRAAWPGEADLLYLPSSTTLKRLSLGHHEFFSDLVAAKANVYFGTQLSTGGRQQWLDRYFHTAIDLDPQFQRLYLSGAAMVVYGSTNVVLDNVLKADAIIERGIATFPFEWEMWFQSGFNKFFELPKLVGPKDPRAAAWRQTGVEHLRQAATFNNVPAYLPNLVSRLLTKQGHDELAIKHLEQAYALTTNDETRTQIRNKLLSLRRANRGATLDAARMRFEDSLRQGYPFAPEAFTVVAGPRRPRTVTTTASVTRPDR